MAQKHVASSQDNGKILYHYLRREMHFSASLVRRLKNAHALFVNGRPVYTNHVLNTGDVVEVDLLAAEPPCDLVPENGPLEILDENEGLIAVNKPAGILVHPSHARYTGTLSNFVAGYMANTYGLGCCHAVNRLDRDTSGVVLFAKNSHYKDLAAKALKEAGALKEYLALAFGQFSEEKGTISLPIKRLEEGNMLRIVSPDGQDAVTHYEVLGGGILEGEYVSLLKLRLETGRTHQIRVHCLALGHPLLGDVLYHTQASSALSEKLGISAQALHAFRLQFCDPVTSTFKTLTAGINRADMRNILSLPNFSIDRIKGKLYNN